MPLILDALPRWAELNDDAATARHRPARRDPHRTERIADARRVRRQRGRLGARLRPPQRRARSTAQFPAFSVPEGYSAMFEHEAGVLFADRTVRALQDRAARHGAALHFDEPVISWDASGDGVVVRTASATYHAARLVITAGSWTSRLAAELGLPLAADPGGQRVVRTASSRRAVRSRSAPGVRRQRRRRGRVRHPRRRRTRRQGRRWRHTGRSRPCGSRRERRRDRPPARVRRPLPAERVGFGVVGPDLSLHRGARRALRHRPPPRTRQRRDRVAVLGPRLQVHDGDRPAAGRARVHRPDHPADRLVLDRPLRTAQRFTSRRPTLSAPPARTGTS